MHRKCNHEVYHLHHHYQHIHFTIYLHKHIQQMYKNTVLKNHPRINQLVNQSMFLFRKQTNKHREGDRQT